MKEPQDLIIENTRLREENKQLHVELMTRESECNAQISELKRKIRDALAPIVDDYSAKTGIKVQTIHLYHDDITSIDSRYSVYKLATISIDVTFD